MSTAVRHGGGSPAVDGAALVELTRALAGADSLEGLERAFAPRFGRVLSTPMYGFYALDRTSGQIERNVGVNVSDVFVSRYVAVMDVDPLLARARASGRPVYNLDVMPADEWEETDVYRHAYSVHRMRHVVEVPIVDDGTVVGALHCGSTDDRNYTGADLRAIEAVARILALQITRIHQRRQRDRGLEEALAALELAGTALVTSGPHAGELRLNAAARRLLEAVVDRDDALYRLLARAPGQERFARRVDVVLQGGERALLHARSQLLSDGGLVSILELRAEHPSIDPGLLSALTPRQAEVAMHVADGRSDPEIAEHLGLSRYTVQQYVKQVYRALEVDSRVALTRLLLGAPVRRRRA